MTDERWEEILHTVREKFAVHEDTVSELPDGEGPGTIAAIIFDSPTGRVKLARTTKPRVLDKRTLGSRRIGSQASVEYIYSDTEQVHQFTAWRWDERDGEWRKLALDGESIRW